MGCWVDGWAAESLGWWVARRQGWRIGTGWAAGLVVGQVAECMDGFVGGGQMDGWVGNWLGK